MHLASHYIHPTPRGGRCRVRVYLPGENQDAPVVICSELPNNEGSSVTYSAHRVAVEAIRSHGLQTPLVWIEHWPKESTGGGSETSKLVVLSNRRGPGFCSGDVSPALPYVLRTFNRKFAPM